MQNELLKIMLEVCCEKISQKIKETNFFAVTADEASDIADIFQMVMVYRYVVKGKPVERFCGFFTPEKHDAKTLASCIVELEYHKNNETPAKLIAQTYDGASVMAGSSGGVQAIVKKYFPKAEYVRYYAQQLNLIFINTASINRSVRVFFATLQGICTFFSSTS